MASSSAPVHPARYLTLFLVLLIGVYLLVFLTGDKQAKPKLGIDLQGGTRVTLTARTPDGSAPTREALNQAQQIISARVERARRLRVRGHHRRLQPGHHRAGQRQQRGPQPGPDGAAVHPARHPRDSGTGPGPAATERRRRRAHRLQRRECHRAHRLQRRACLRAHCQGRPSLGSFRPSPGAPVSPPSPAEQAPPPGAPAPQPRPYPQEPPATPAPAAPAPEAPPTPAPPPPTPGAPPAPAPRSRLTSRRWRSASPTRSSCGRAPISRSRSWRCSSRPPAATTRTCWPATTTRTFRW